MSGLNFLLMLIASFLFCIIFSIDFFNFGFQKPFLYNFTLSCTILTANFLSIAAFVIYQHMDCGFPPIYYPLFFSLTLASATILKRNKYSALFILAAFAISIYTMNCVYLIVDNKSYSFEHDFTKFNKVLCGQHLAQINDLLEKAKKESSNDEAINNKKLDYAIFDSSSEIYIHLKNKYQFENKYEFERKVAKRMRHTAYSGIYALYSQKHNFYSTGGSFKDSIIYCDDISSAEVKAALDKAKLNLAKPSGDNK